MTAGEAKELIQKTLGVVADRKIGAKSRTAFEALSVAPDDAQWPSIGVTIPGYQFSSALSPVKNRGVPPISFLNQLVNWGKTADDSIFESNSSNDVYSAVSKELGPYGGLSHRKAVMLECLRVLAGFESSWNWNEGVDVTNRTSMQHLSGQETGAWQVSYDSLSFGLDLRTLVDSKTSGTIQDFIDKMKSDHPFAMEYAARLLHHTIKHNGPVLRGEFNPYLKRDSVEEFDKFLSA